MSKHVASRPVRHLKVVASVVMVVAFVTLFVGSATGLIGASDKASDRLTGVHGQPSDNGANRPAKPESAHAGSLQTTGGTIEATDEPAEVVTDVPPQEVKGAKKLKRTLAWLRRGLADETTFRVGTLNLLGDSHTRPGGNKKGWASGYTRMGWAYPLIQQADLDVIGFQEFEEPQFHRFMSLGGGAWDAYPGPTLDRGSIRDSIAWRTDTWKLVEASSIAIPYFHGQMIRRPVIKLENIASGREVWFFNTHNPASTPRWGNNARWRAAAISLETHLANELASDGTPVVFTGDFNDRAETFCPLTEATDLEAANGGSNEGSCIVPPSPDIDWVFGSGMEFSGFVSAARGVVGRVTDHPFVYAEANIPEEPLGGDQPSGSASPSADNSDAAAD